MSERDQNVVWSLEEGERVVSCGGQLKKDLQRDKVGLEIEQDLDNYRGRK